MPLGKVFRGDALAQQGEVVEGIAQMREGIAELRSFGTLFSLPSFFPALASACARRGNVGDGLVAVEEGLALVHKGGDQFSLPEIHRVKATLVLARSAADKDVAEAAYREAIEVARGQQARLLELRAATSLARLWGEMAGAAPPVNCWRRSITRSPRASTRPTLGTPKRCSTSSPDRGRFWHV